ncbi:hypothetical protein H311_01925 [Anncaliia algerae PRA109]|nr:hypothetical protein H311_01925 [Anncaliia algerae PRA109]
MNMLTPFLIVPFIINVVCIENETENHDSYIVKGLNYDLSVSEKNYYHGHLGEDYDFLKEVKSIDEGFNVIIRAKRKYISVSLNENTVLVNINRTIADHYIKNASYQFVVSGGELYDVYIEEILRGDVVHSVLALRIKKSASNGY